MAENNQLNMAGGGGRGSMSGVNRALMTLNRALTMLKRDFARLKRDFRGRHVLSERNHGDIKNSLHCMSPFRGAYAMEVLFFYESAMQ